MPTIEDCYRELGKNYTANGVELIAHTEVRALEGCRPVDLMTTDEGRQRVYDWARALTEGVMG